MNFFISRDNVDCDRQIKASTIYFRLGVKTQMLKNGKLLVSVEKAALFSDKRLRQEFFFQVIYLQNR